MAKEPRQIILAEKITVTTAGSPVQLPAYRPVSPIRVSSVGNTGSVHLGASSVETKDSRHRFSIGTGQNIPLPFEPDLLSDLWLDSDNNGDGISILCEVEQNG